MSIIIHPALSPRGDGDVMTRRAQSDGTSCCVQYRAQPPFASLLLWICFGDEDCVLCEQKRPDSRSLECVRVLFPFPKRRMNKF